MSVIGRHLSEVCEALSLLDQDAVARAVEIIKLTKAATGTVWLAGNGGSAATASHFANDLSKMGKVRAICISDMTPTTLAYGNDDGWERMFANTLSGFVKPMDTVIAISCSGNSKNIVNFLECAPNNVHRIAMTGLDPSLVSLQISDPDVLIHAMANEITVQEDVHSFVCHAIARTLRDG